MLTAHTSDSPPPFVSPLADVPRAALPVLHLLSRCDSKTATYAAIAFGLNLTTKWARESVRQGVEAGVFEILRPRGMRGPGAKAYVRLTAKADAINRILFGGDE